MKENKGTLSVTINQRLDNNYEDLIITAVTYNDEIYYEISTFCKKINRSANTVRRRLKHVQIRERDQYYLRLGNKLFVSEAIFHDVTNNFESKDELNGNYENLLRGFNWDYFGAVHYSRKYSITRVAQIMSNFFNKISSTFPNAELRMFYTTEKNSGEGYHSHFILYSDIKPNSNVLRLFNEHFRGKGTTSFGNTYIAKYDPTKGGIGYVLKEINEQPDGYDLLMKNC